MNKSIEIQAKTIEAAIEEGLAQLNASYDEVDVDIIQEAGLFKKAKVRITLKKPETPEAPVSAEIKPEKPVKKQTKPSVGEQLPPKFQTTLDFTKKLLELLENPAEVTYEVTEKTFNINVGGGDGAGQIIGKGGEVMNAIQTIIGAIAIKNSGEESRRVYFNVGDYKERREETLKAMALSKAEKVKETGKYIKFEPMSARERAIIHSALQGIKGIRTYSTGKDPHRCLCIAPAKKEEL
jgi:spoIIIJ-associated protein